MTVTVPDGVNANGRQPVFVIQESALPNINDETTSIPLAAVLAGEKIDCYYELGGITLNRTATTRSRQRACEKVAQEIKTGETIDGTISPIYDQQQLDDADAVINAAYRALPEGGTVFLFVAHGWDSDDAPTAATVGDLWRVKVQQVDKPFMDVEGADLTATVNLSGNLYRPDVTLTGTGA